MNYLMYIYIIIQTQNHYKMKTYNVILTWGQNTSHKGASQMLAEGVSIEKAEAALMARLDRHDNVTVNYEEKTVESSDYNPSLIWESGDGSLRFGDYQIIIDEIV